MPPPNTADVAMDPPQAVATMTQKMGRLHTCDMEKCSSLPDGKPCHGAEINGSNMAVPVHTHVTVANTSWPQHMRQLAGGHKACKSWAAKGSMLRRMCNKRWVQLCTCIMHGRSPKHTPTPHRAARVRDQAKHRPVESHGQRSQFDFSLDYHNEPPRGAAFAQRPTPTMEVQSLWRNTKHTCT